MRWKQSPLKRFWRVFGNYFDYQNIRKSKFTEILWESNNFIAKYFENQRKMLFLGIFIKNLSYHVEQWMVVFAEKEFALKSFAIPQKYLKHIEFANYLFYYTINYLEI